ncbi:MAG: hypothetical protein ACK5KL_14245 [Dysgonomonas sp.]
METLISGAIIGILTSLAVWLLTCRILVPKITFAQKIAKTQYSDNEFVYYIKFQNKGWRDIIDIFVYCTLTIKGIDRNSPEITDFVSIPMGSMGNNIPRLSREREEENIKGLRQCKINISNFDTFPVHKFSDEINEKYKNGTLSLEDLLSLDKSAEMKFGILGTDIFSGARKYIESKPFSINDIVEGSYMKDSLDILEK